MARQFATALDDAVLVYWALLTFGPLSLGVGLSVVIGQVQVVGGSEMAEGYHYGFIYYGAAVGFVPLCAQPFRTGQPCFGRRGRNGVLLGNGTLLFAWYMGNFDGCKSIYGAFAAVPFFLLRLNLLWTLVLGGAVLTSSLSYWRGEAFRRSLDARGRFDDVLKILLLLDSAQQNGKALPVQEFRRHINMGFDELGELLKTGATRLCLFRPPRLGLENGAESIDLAELFKLFVYRPQTLNKDKVNQTVDHIMQPCLETLNMTLAEFGAHTKTILLRPDAV